MPDHSVIIPHDALKPIAASTGCLKRVLVFSPDADLARFLLLNLEDRFQIVRKSTLEDFDRSIREISPNLILIDLYTFSIDIIKQLDIIRKMTLKVPIIALRAYTSLTPEMNRSIDDLTDVVFYKPVDVELITQAIEDLIK